MKKASQKKMKKKGEKHTQKKISNIKLLLVSEFGLQMSKRSLVKKLNPPANCYIKVLKYLDTVFGLNHRYTLWGLTSTN